MKKMYMVPEPEIKLISVCDIITGSPLNLGNNNDPLEVDYNDMDFS